MFDITFLGWRTIAKRLILWFLLIGFLPILTLTILVYITTVNGLTDEVQRGLVALADTKAEDIEIDAQEAKRDVTALAQLPSLQAGLAHFDEVFVRDGFDSPAYAEVEQLYSPLLLALVQSGYRDLALISAAGDVLYTDRKEDDLGTNLQTGLYSDSELAKVFEKVKTSLDTETSDFNYYPPSHGPLLFVAAPVFQEGHLLGVVAVQYSPEEFYKFISSFSGLGDSGELIIAMQDGNDALVVIPLRHNPDAAFKVRIPLGSDGDQSIQNAVQGLNGDGLVVDYQGRETIAAWRYLPTFRWGLVVKVDTAEAFASLASQRNVIIAVAVLTLVLAAAGTFIATRSIAEPFIQLKQTKDALQQSLDHTETLYNASLALSATTDLPEVLRLILEELQQVVPYDSATVQVLRDGYFEVIDGNGFRDKQKVIGLRFDIQKWPDEQIVATRRPVILNEAKTEWWSAVTEAGGDNFPQGIPSWLGLPVLFGDRLIGKIGMDKAEPNFFTPEHTKLAVAFAAQAGIAIENSRLFQQTEQARQAAETANQAKSTFLANMSHELRTPLNAILGFARLLHRDTNLTAHQRENLDIINRSGEYLLSLINDILNIAKIEAGQLTVQPQSFDLYQLLDELEEMFQLRAAEKGLQLMFEPTPDLPRFIRTDQSKLHQVLINLISNAIKFTEEGGVTVRVGSRKYEAGSIEVESRKEKPYPLPPTPYSLLHVEIEDTGAGIAADEQARLFEAFAQTRSGEQAQEGTGLGLAISRQYVRLLGGDISVSSQVGKGSIFAFEWPVELVAESELAVSRPKRRVIGLEPGQPQYRLLIVEDRWTNRRLLLNLLEPLGFELREAENGLEAIEIWKAWQPHLIWMDMRMPVLDGYEATRRIKKTLQGQATLIIALTASSFEEQRAGVLSAGCDDFVRKPFREEEIFDAIARHLGLKYVYEESADGATGSREHREPDYNQLRDELHTLDPVWLDRLHYAASRADSEAVFELIATIEGDHPRLAQSLTRLVNDFRFDVLAKVAPSVEEETEP
ncbi:MAG: response regulator [Anaerolineae bacterium]|nr:response regulator [Anaerolineae bacterium]